VASLAIANKVITRGFGAPRPVANRCGPIAQGYGGVPAFVPAVIVGRHVPSGQSGRKRRLQELDEVIVWARLVTINDREPEVPVKGWIRLRIDRASGHATALAEHLSSRARAAWETMKVSVQRLK
jgi:hypothetical protein